MTSCVLPLPSCHLYKVEANKHLQPFPGFSTILHNQLAGNGATDEFALCTAESGESIVVFNPINGQGSPL